ncbi:MAG TPA: hypothetical protein VMW52_05850, partial [Phycisphaerae bacterium]|nr:hypothetical protein [Phycisphaerae bacterium]
FSGGKFYPDYSEAIHVAPSGQLKYNPDLPLFRSFDWGSNPPTRVLWIQVDSRHPGNPNVMVADEDAVVRVIDEYQCLSPAGSTQAQEVLKYHKDKGYGPVVRDYCDPAGKSFIAEFNKTGIYPWGRTEAGRRLNVRKEGQEIIRQKLLSATGKSTLIIAPECPLLRVEFRACHYPERKQAQPAPEDHVKVDDHGLDALRYFLAGRFPLQEWQIQE